MKKTGIIISNLDTTQINFDALSQDSVFVFVKELSRSNLRHNLCMMDISEIWGFDDGALIATDIDTALFMEKSVNNSNKIFFLYDFEDTKDFEDKERLHNLLNNQNIKIAVRSKHISKKLKQHFNIDADFIWRNIDDFCTKA